MRSMGRVGLMVAVFVLTSWVLLGCGGAEAQENGADSTTAQSQTTVLNGGGAGDETPAGDENTGKSQPATTASDPGEVQPETEVAGLPAEFPGDVPVHPGTVTNYEAIEVTESTTVYQLTVKTTASLDDVIEWYQNELPSGWSVGFLEKKGREAKIALNGGDYTPADPNGRGGGVIIGLLAAEGTEILTTVTVVAP